MIHGLPEVTVAKLREVLSRFPEVEKAVLYGSRAKGTHRPGSDIDLTLFGDGVTTARLGEIADSLDDLYLPYTLDLSLFASLRNATLREHIERVGVVLYDAALHRTSAATGRASAGATADERGA